MQKHTICRRSPSRHLALKFVTPPILILALRALKLVTPTILIMYDYIAGIFF